MTPTHYDLGEPALNVIRSSEYVFAKRACEVVWGPSHLQRQEGGTSGVGVKRSRQDRGPTSLLCGRSDLWNWTLIPLKTTQGDAPPGIPRIGLS